MHFTCKCQALTTSQGARYIWPRKATLSYLHEVYRVQNACFLNTISWNNIKYFKLKKLRKIKEAERSPGPYLNFPLSRSQKPQVRMFSIHQEEINRLICEETGCRQDLTKQALLAFPSLLMLDPVSDCVIVPLLFMKLALKIPSQLFHVLSCLREGSCDI